MKIRTGAAAAVLLAAATAGCASTGSPAAVHSPAAVSQPAAAAPAPSPAPPPTPSYTVEQQQAIDSAQGYLDMGTGFSKAGLMEQLTSPAGEQFSHSLARFALAHVEVNWNQQAVESAQGYVDMGGFSYASLVDQLHSPAGEGFTLAQARHGATLALRP